MEIMKEELYRENYIQYVRRSGKVIGIDRYCNICGYRIAAFLPFNKRKEAVCPVCGSLERHRHVFILLNGLLPFLEGRRVLHFAPEAPLKKLFLSSKAEYFDADLEPGRASHQVDITKIPFQEGFFDHIIAIHVLEHIEDDMTAMKELFRVLAPKGTAFLAVPAKGEKTLEIPGATSPEERLRLYGQEDHVRMYAFGDFCNRLESVGFSLSVSRAEAFPEGLRNEVRIGDDIVIARKQ